MRGVRIEPGEIEAALRRDPAVLEAVVTAHALAPGDVRLAAYVVPRPGAALDPVALRVALRERLPDSLVPAAIVALRELPLSTNGKLDRRALPPPDWSRQGAESAAPDDEKPLTPLETTLARIWCEVLRLDRVGRHDDFFALGGHSLLAVQIVSRVRAALDVEVPVRALFQTPTLAGFARRVAGLQAAGATRRAPPILPLPREGRRTRLSVGARDAGAPEAP